MCLRGLFSWLGSLNSVVDYAELEPCCDQFIIPFDSVQLHVHDDPPVRLPTPGDAPDFTIMSGYRMREADMMTVPYS